MLITDNVASNGKILLIYQGNNADNYVSYVLEIASKYEFGVWMTKYNNEPKSDYYDMFLSDVKRCDLAIALVTLDERKASRAGNLWLEVGTWLGIKSSKTLLICLQEEQNLINTDDESKLIAAPSDLIGRPMPRFTDKNSLHVAIKDHLDNLKSMKRRDAKCKTHDCNGVYYDHLKVKDTFKIDIQDESDHILASCCVNGQPIECNHHKESLCFISELLRMGKSNREYAILTDCLSQIAVLCEKITRDSGKGQCLKDVRDNMDDLDVVLNRLRDINQNLLTRSNQQKELPNEKNHLISYLKYRLTIAKNLCAKKIIYAHKPDDDVRPTVIQNLIDSDVDMFVKWATDYEINYTKYEIYKSGFKEGSQENVDISNIFNCGDIAGKIACLLRLLGEKFFDDCRKIIHKEIRKIEDLNKIDIYFHDIRYKLPQNVPAEENLNGIPRIWPRPTHETE